MDSSIVLHKSIGRESVYILIVRGAMEINCFDTSDRGNSLERPKDIIYI